MRVIDEVNKFIFLFIVWIYGKIFVSLQRISEEMSPFRAIPGQYAKNRPRESIEPHDINKLNNKEMKKHLLKTILLLLCLITGRATSAWADGTTGTITFGKNNVAINSQNVTAADTQGNSWTITTAGTTSFTSNTAYYQVGSSNKPATSITFTTTLPDAVNVTTVSAKFGGFSNTAGTVTLKVGDTTVGTGSLNATSDVTVSSTSAEVGNTITVTITNIAKGVKAYYISYTYSAGGGGDTPTTYTVTYNANGATSGDVPTDDNEYEEGDEVTVLGNTGNLAKTGCAFGGWNTLADGEGDNYDEDDTFEITANTTLYAQWIPFTITALSNNESYGTVSLNDNVITATPATGYTYADPAYTVNPDNSATVAQDGNTFTVTPTADTEVTINFEMLPTYTVTFGDEGSVTQETPGAEVTLPSREAISSYTFAGWSETNVETETTDAPTIIPAGGYIPTANITLYPVYTKIEGGGGTVNKTASVNIGTYATANSWINSTQYEEITIDENVTATADGGGNTGKYYSSNSSWRLYANESATLNIALAEGELTSVTITYTGNKLTYNGEDITSGTAVNVSGNSAAFAVSGSSSNSQVTAISVDYTISGGGTTYYWSAPVAAAVERPEIVVAENPFMFSTTATITCETEGAAIKYSFDGENWNNYEEELTITEATTLYAKAVKDETESSVVSVEITKNLATPSVTIDATGITNTNVYDGTEAGSLAATVTYNEEAVEGAAVTWSGSNNEVATIDAETGAVTLVAAGSVTFTATYAGDSDYAEKTATYNMTVTNIDPNAPGTENNPYTVAQARAAIDAGEGVTDVYVAGIVSQVDSYNSKYSSITYWISEDGTTTDQFEVYSGKGIDGANFSSKDDIQVGDRVVVKGNITLYNSSIYEFASGNQLVSLVRIEKPVAPSFSVEEGTYTEAQSVELSTSTEGAVIYYTVDGTEPTAESTEYTSAIEITETTTIKAIAVKDDVASDVATATYTINYNPSITIAETTIDAPAEGKENLVALTYANLTISTTNGFDVQFYDEEDNETAQPDWIDVEVVEDNGDYSVFYTIGANESTEARTAYFKVFAMNNEEPVYSDLVTVNQAGFVVDFVTLPFAWEGSSENGKSSLETITGVTTNSLGTDYAASNAPYRVKLDGTGDYVLVKTDCQPVLVSVDVKMLGGGNESTITVQESADGEVFTDVEDLVISGAQNTVLYLQTSNAFKADTRYVRLYFTKGSNVGLGGITIEKAFDTVTIGAVGYTTYVTKHNVSFPAEVEAYIATRVNENQEYISLTQVYAAPKGTPVVLKNDEKESGTYNYELAPAASTDDVSGNLLKASDGSVVSDGTSIYALGVGKVAPYEGVVGFYVVKEGQTVPAGKAYLEISSASGVNGFRFVFDEETGIQEIGQLDNIQYDNCYDLSGRRIQKPAKGLYIVNGKKVFIKK